MSAVDVNALFTRAEQAFAAGRLEAARADLIHIRRLVADHPAVLHLLALVEKKRGAFDESEAAFERALALAPRDPQVRNNYAGLLAAAGQPDAALEQFDLAIAADPAFADARHNRALLLQRTGRLDEALAELDRLGPGAKVQSARASVLRDLGRLDDAADAYDSALRAEPRRLTALHGRARTAMERGEPDASERYGEALAVAPGDETLQLGLAEALEAEGKPGALELLARAVRARPTWAEGQSALARMRWEAGEGEAFTRDLEQAIEAGPTERGLWQALVAALAAADLFAEAAEAADRAEASLGEDPELRLQRAAHLSRIGEVEQAERLFAALPRDLPARPALEIWHRLRTGDLARALELAEQVRAQNPWDVSAWAATGLVWRATGDPQAEWLHGQPGLIQAQQLGLGAAQIDAVARCLRTVHRTRVHPIGQSLRGGTQTRGRLFDRTEPELRLLRDAIRDAVLAYWQALPPADPRHPLLRWRDKAPRFGGSWSVRLSGGGFHVAHVHPHGILSSACYLTVPDPDGEHSGWLEIGRPPPDLALALEPLATVEPRPGRLALFPSTLYHGTRPFAAGERLTAAFDIVGA